MRRLLLVRHGESEWNAGRRLQGQADVALSKRGEEQALALRPVVAALRPGRVLSSSLRRARDTAALLGFPDAELRDELREIDVGAWTGASIDELMAKDGEAYSGWRAGGHTPPRGEPWAGFRARTGALVNSLLGEAGEPILIVCHGGVVRALLDGLLSLPPRRIVPVAPGSLTTLRQIMPNGRTEIRLELFNFSPGGLVLDAPD